MTQQVVALVQAAGARRVSAREPVWHLSPPWLPFPPRSRRFERRRAAILAGTLALPAPAYLAIAVNPQAYDVGGPWAHAGPDTWPVPISGRAPDLLAQLLHVGSWHLYTAPRPLDRKSLPDAFLWAPHEVTEFALRRSVSVLVHADSRNRHWRIWVEAAASEERVAA